MVSSNDKRVTTYLSEEDLKLWKIALREYNLTEAELCRKILSSWIFNNKLNLEGKNGFSATKRETRRTSR